MDAAYLSALSALAGSVVGGLTMALSAWISQSVSARAGLISSHLARRQELFRDFIISGSRVYGEALTSSEPKIPELVELYALLSRMRVLCRPETVAAGEKLVEGVVERLCRSDQPLQIGGSLRHPLRPHLQAFH